MTISQTASELRLPGPARWASRWCVLGVLALTATGLVAALFHSPATAVAQSASVGGSPTGLYAVAGQLTAKTYGLYLIDTERQSLVIYEYVPRASQSEYLQLRAARTLQYDVQLEAYNTSPDPAEVADLVRQARRISDESNRP